MEKKLLIVPLTPLGVQGNEVICQLENGVVWGIPIQVFEQFTSLLLEEKSDD